MSNSFTSKRHDLPSDTQMNRLLERFFLQEVPAELNAGVLFPAQLASHSNAARVELTLLPDAQPTVSGIRRQPVAVRITVASSLVAVVALLLVVSSFQLPRASQFADTIARQKSTSTDTDLGPLNDGQQERVTEDLMLVSPRGGQRNVRDSAALGNNGVTLEEADSVNLNPESSNTSRHSQTP